MEKYNYNIRILHWIMAILIIFMLCLGITMKRVDNQEISSLLFSIHESIGVMILILAIIRLVIRINTSIPMIPEIISPIIRKLARGVHYIIYFFMIFIPLVGFFGSMLQGYDIAFFGTKIPVFVSINKACGKFLMEIHEIAPYILLVFIILHIAAFIKHQYCDEIDIFDSISWKK